MQGCNFLQKAVFLSLTKIHKSFFIPERRLEWGSVDHPMADLFSRNIYDLGYPKGLKNGNFKFFCQISSSSRPFLLIFCQNFFFQKIDLYPFNFELSCSHQFLTENDPPYHFGKGRSILRCQNWNFGSIIILSTYFCGFCKFLV